MDNLEAARLQQAGVTPCEPAPCCEEEVMVRQAIKHASLALQVIGEHPICLANPRGKEIVAAHAWLGMIRVTLQGQIAALREKHAKENAEKK